MLNSAACRSKTAHAPDRSPCCEKSSRGKGLMQGRGLRCRRAYEISRKTAQLGPECVNWTKLIVQDDKFRRI